jgi:large subunit ribosomal protein L22
MATKKKNVMARKPKFEREAVARASIRHVRISPQKVRMVLSLIRGKQVDPAIQVLKFSPKKGAKIVEKLLRSAVANAKEKGNADLDSLWVTGAWANMGQTLHRIMPRAQGRATPINKRSSHITVLLGQR